MMMLMCVGVGVCFAKMLEFLGHFDDSVGQNT